MQEPKAGELRPSSAGLQQYQGDDYQFASPSERSRRITLVAADAAPCGFNQGSLAGEGISFSDVSCQRRRGSVAEPCR